MEKLFESYIALQLRKMLDTSLYSMSIQDKTYHLFEQPSKKFLMKPDIVIKNNIEDTKVIIDTKWKILSSKKTNYGISQEDMYQMYAYQKKYHAKNIILLYPKSSQIEQQINQTFSSTDGVVIHIRFVDLLNIKESLESLAKKM